MRNLVEHPVTKDEVLQTMLRVYNDKTETERDRIGAMDAFVLGLALAYIDQHMPADWTFRP